MDMHSVENAPDSAKANAKEESPGQQLRDWHANQTIFATQRDLASAIGVDKRTVWTWFAGRKFPKDPLCDKLYEITRLDCFSPAGREEIRAARLAQTRLRWSAASKRAWADPKSNKRRCAALKKSNADPKVRKKISDAQKKVCADPEVQAHRAAGRVKYAQRLLKETLAPRPATKPGRHTQKDEEDSWFEVGREVEESIPVGLRLKRSAIVAARSNFLTSHPHYEYDTVGRYHQKYRRWLKKQKQKPLRATTDINS
jgi:hypothetical protein